MIKKILIIKNKFVLNEVFGFCVVGILFFVLYLSLELIFHKNTKLCKRNIKQVIILLYIFMAKKIHYSQEKCI